jgi:hypothetical protein
LDARALVATIVLLTLFGLTGLAAADLRAFADGEATLTSAAS